MNKSLLFSSSSGVGSHGGTNECSMGPIKQLVDKRLGVILTSTNDHCIDRDTFGRVVFEINTGALSQWGCKTGVWMSGWALGLVNLAVGFERWHQSTIPYPISNATGGHVIHDFPVYVTIVGDTYISED